jgi:hypothetical protein
MLNLDFLRKWRISRILPNKTKSWAKSRRLPEPPKIPKVPTGQKLSWCPFAFKGFPRGATKGTYPFLYPQGAVIHFTSRNQKERLVDAVRHQNQKRHLYFVISEDGSISQNFPLTHWGYHSGASSWGCIKNSVDRYLVGISICCAGKLSKKGVPWFGNAPYPLDTIRVVEERDNIAAGTYQRFSLAQEESIVKLLKWLKSNNPEVFDYTMVLGHDEVSPKRKNDPSGSLSVTMPELRELLKNG